MLYHIDVAYFNKMHPVARRFSAPSAKKDGSAIRDCPRFTRVEMQRPVWEGRMDLSILKKLQVPVVLDGEHAGPDDVFRDVKLVWRASD